MSPSEKSLNELTALSSIHVSLKIALIFLVYFINFATLYLFTQFFVASDQSSKYLLFFITSFLLTVPSFTLIQK